LRPRRAGIEGHDRSDWGGEDVDPLEEVEHSLVDPLALLPGLVELLEGDLHTGFGVVDQFRAEHVPVLIEQTAVVARVEEAAQHPEGAVGPIERRPEIGEAMAEALQLGPSLSV